MPFKEENKIYILVIGADNETTDLITAFVSEEQEMQLSGFVHDGVSGIERAKALEPSIVLIDVSVPEGNILDLTARLTTEVPAAKVIVMLLGLDPEWLDKAVSAGVASFLVKPLGKARFYETIRAIHSGNNG